MSKFKLAFGLHNHQPVGNFDFVFDDSHIKAYQPFIDLIKTYPEIRFSLHQSGILWNWQKKHYPEYLYSVKSLVDSNQIEILTGGFYEPILTSIPEKDINGQIKKLNQFISKAFNQRPNGAWLTERIWEPHLPKMLNQSGIKYLPVDDTHFIYAGLDQSQLTGPYITEFENYELTILPISKKLRYLIPFGTIDELIGFLKTQAEKDPNGMLIYADDGEKFGSWPKTHDHCYKDRWLSRFFDAVRENSDWLELIPLKEAAAVNPVGRVYLQSASYAEMLHWALPASSFIEYELFENFLKEQQLFDRFGRFVRGGHWRGFLTKYEEANLMHKKMMMISEQLNRLEESNTENLDIIRDKLYAAQCNCPYWHGVFGGLYLPHIRSAVYSNLVEAERLLWEKSNHANDSFSVTDYDKDGHDEIIFQNDAISGIFKPANGGMISELSSFKHDFSLTDTLSRRKEGYHHKLEHAITPDKAHNTASIHDQVLAKEEGLHHLLVHDYYLKRCFIDHLFEPGFDFNRFKQNRFDHSWALYDKVYKQEIDNDKLTLSIVHNKINLKKTFVINQNVIDVEYELTAEDGSEVELLFGIENNFNFQAGHAEDRFILIDNERNENSYLDSVGDYKQKKSFAMVDQWRMIQLELSSSQSSDIWHLPIFSVSLSEGGFEKVYQGTTFVNLYKAKLSANPCSIKLSLKIE